jgi:hypothetical protein
VRRLEKILEQILEKLTKIESVKQEQGKKLTTMEKTQNYHSEMFGALIHAQEAQKAQIDQLVNNTAHIQGEQAKLIQTVDRLSGEVTFLVRKSAEH